MRFALVLVVSGFLSGCAFLPVNRVIISPELKKAPVKGVLVLEPGFGKKHRKYNFPGDLKEIEPANQKETANLLQPMLVEALEGVGLEVELPCVLNEDVRAWAKKIVTDLANNRVPLKVEPIDLSVESILLFGVVEYGQIMTQLHWKAFFEKKYHVIGRMSWEHVCDIQAILVNPRTGTVLMDVRHRVAVEVYKEDPELLKQMAKEVMQVIANAFPK